MCDFTPLKAVHIPGVVSAFKAMGWDNPASQYEKYLEEQDHGIRTVIMAFDEDRSIGYLTVLSSSGYRPFCEAAIPEVSDLNVILDDRNKGME